VDFPEGKRPADVEAHGKYPTRKPEEEAKLVRHTERTYGKLHSLSGEHLAFVGQSGEKDGGKDANEFAFFEGPSDADDLLYFNGNILRILPG
jgi:hypothetical protein